MMVASDMVRELMKSAYFKGIPSTVLHAIAVWAEDRRWRTGSRLGHRGQPAEGILIVLQGAVEVRRPGLDGVERTTAVAGSGMIVGAVAVVEGGPNLASYVAVDNGRGAWFPLAPARRLLGERGAAGSAFRRALILSLSQQLLGATSFLNRVASRQPDALDQVSSLLDGG